MPSQDKLSGVKNLKLMQSKKITLNDPKLDKAYSLLWEAVKFLSAFDFGYAFSSPVDLKVSELTTFHIHIHIHIHY